MPPPHCSQIGKWIPFLNQHLGWPYNLPMVVLKRLSSKGLIFLMFFLGGIGFFPLKQIARFKVENVGVSHKPHEQRSKPYTDWFIEIIVRAYNPYKTRQYIFLHKTHNQACGHCSDAAHFSQSSVPITLSNPFGGKGIGMIGRINTWRGNRLN